MKKITIFIIVALVLGTAMPAMAQVYAEYSSHSGTITPTGGTIVEAVQAPYDGKFVQLAPLSWIILVFPGDYVAAPDGTVAADLRVDIYDTLYPADAEIYVSLDGSLWTSMGVHADTANIDIDLEGVGNVKYIAVDQWTYYIDPAYPNLGFDLDGIEALNPVELLAATIDKTMAPVGTVELGDHLTVTLEVDNPYPDPVTVVDEIPEGLAYIPGTLTATPGPAGPVTVVDNTLTTTVGNGTHTIEFELQVVEVGYEDSDPLTNIVKVYAPGATPGVDDPDDTAESDEIILSPYDGFSKAIATSTEPDPYNVPMHTDVHWLLRIEIENIAGDDIITMEDVVVKDNLGGDLEMHLCFSGCDYPGKQLIQPPSPAPEVSKKSGKTEKLHLSWDLAVLSDEDLTQLYLEISTDVNPGQKKKDPVGKNEYTSDGEHDLNSGATLKFTDPDTGLQLSAHTCPITVTAFDPEALVLP